MQQPELGRQLTALRKEKNLTQEELVGKSNVSVRTIQRIEAGEVTPRIITVKILLEALGESYESFLTKTSQVDETRQKKLANTKRNTLLIAALAGAVYLVAEIILGVLDIASFTEDRNWSFRLNTIYAILTMVMIASFTLFARGFIALSNLFENTLLKVTTYLLVVAVAGKGILDIGSLSVQEVDSLWLVYAVVSVMFGAIGIGFGISLIRLQDSMGELSRIAGMLEIGMGFLMTTVVLFFLFYVIMVPAVIVEILLLYRGYEYVSRSESAVTSA